ncbi:mediator complex subunit [Puccinia graminis f. sp. tritici]|uniref:Mediator of RNA polymerase II transcription subunit 14 n=1 Tax=Puccinia graminis f. sp. tritici TaxID=56615 RepID=A0A5B0NKQ7_PUCGR|nr:mediator complex subunit [Puccinia graminis f. sp. tritici]
MTTILEGKNNKDEHAHNHKQNVNNEPYYHQSKNQKHQNNHQQQQAFISTSPASSSSSSSNHQLTKKFKSECSAQRHIQFDQETLNQIDRVELQRLWGPHLVPLQFVIQRTIAQVFNELQILSQISPNLEDYDRKKRVIDFVVHSRRQLIKLLVLVKWSSNSVPVHKIMSIVAFLQRQNSQFERNVNILKASKESFHSARMRNYDLATALQVLTNGYPTLPGRLIDQFDSKPKLSDSEVIKIMQDLNELIRYRLASCEVIPKEFRSYRIYDGRVVFKISRMFECSLTLGGGELDSQWYLLHVEFLFRVTGPRGKDFMSIPQGPVKNQIIECGNRTMAPNTLPTEADPDPKPPERPIMKLFAYLRDLCLNYQLEALHYQASQLGRSAWATHTRLLISPDRSNLTIVYWLHARPVSIPVTRPGQQPPRNPPQPTPQGTLTVRRHIERHSPSRTRVLDFLNGYPLKDKLPSDGQDGDFGASHTERLQVVWRPSEVTSRGGPVTREVLGGLKIREGDEVDFLKTDSGQLELELKMSELCLETIIQRAVRVHTDCTLRRAFSDLTRLDRPAGGSSTRVVPYFASVRLIPWEDTSSSERFAKSIEVVLHARHAVEVLIDQFSGRFRLQSITNPIRLDEGDNDSAHRLGVGCFSGYNPSRLSQSANKINANPSGLRDVLVRLKSDILLDQIEFKARLLGIQTTRNLPIQLQLLSMPSYLSSPSTIPQHIFQLTLYCRLSNFPHHYLLIMVTENGIRCALIIVNQKRDDQPSNHGGSSMSWNVNSVSAVEVPTFSDDLDEDGGVLDQFTLSRTQLQYVYHYCLVQVTLSQLKAPLRQNQISYEQQLPVTTEIIKKTYQEHRNQRPKLTGKPPPSSIKLPEFHQAHEVTGLLLIPLQGFLKPSFFHSHHLLTQKDIFDGQKLALKVLLQPESHFGVQLELRFKFNPDKLKAEELEKIIKSKETNLNSKIVSNYLMRQAKSQSPVTPNPRNFGQPPKDDDDDDDDEDEEPLSRRIQPTRPKPASPAVTNTAEEPRKECPNLEEDPDAEFVDSDSWSIDAQSNQFIMRFQNFNQQIDQIYPLSIQKFINLIHSDADPLP